MEDTIMYEGDVVSLGFDEMPVGTGGPVGVLKTFDLRVVLSENRELFVAAYRTNEKYYRRCVVRLLLDLGLIGVVEMKTPAFGIITDFLREDDEKQQTV